MIKNYVTNGFDMLGKCALRAYGSFVGENDAKYLDSLSPERKVIADEHAKQQSYIFAYNKILKDGPKKITNEEFMALGQYVDFKMQTSLIRELKELKSGHGLLRLQFNPNEVQVDDEEMCFTYHDQLLTTDYLVALTHAAINKVSPIQLGKNAKEYADTVLNCDTIAKMYFDII